MSDLWSHDPLPGQGPGDTAGTGGGLDRAQAVVALGGGEEGDRGVSSEQNWNIGLRLFVDDRFARGDNQREEGVEVVEALGEDLCPFVSRGRQLGVVRRVSRGEPFQRRGEDRFCLAC